MKTPSEKSILRRIHALPIPRNLNFTRAGTCSIEGLTQTIAKSLLYRNLISHEGEFTYEDGSLWLLDCVELTEFGNEVAFAPADWKKASAIAAVMTFILGAIGIILRYFFSKP